MRETERLAELVTGTGYSDLPDTVVESATVAIRDFVGVGMYGSQHPIGEQIRAYANRALPGTETLVLGGSRGSLEGASLCNAVFGHATDYDDTFGSVPIHPTTPVFSATLAVAQHLDATARQLLTGYVLGIETVYRLGHSTYPAHYDGGLHSTGTMGTFGAAAGVCSVLGLSTEQVRHALGIAASATSSLKKNIGTTTKPLHAGHAAQMGIQATLLAESGFTADTSILEGEEGYGAVLGFGGYKPDVIVEGGEKTWGIEDVGFKSYPCVLMAQAPMEALRKIITEHQLAPEDVVSITVTMPDYAEPVLPYTRPETESEAKFSIEFCLGAMLREGDVGIHEFTEEFIMDERTRTAMEKVSRVFDSDALGPDYGQYGGRVTVDAGGETYTRAEKYVPGSPDNLLPESTLREKFIECASTVTTPEDADDLADLLLDLDGVDLDTLIERLDVSGE